MVKIRLRRVGAKKQPSYRVVVADSRFPRDGRFLESIGFYNPLTDPPTVRLDEARVIYWLQRGAQPSGAVAGLLTRQGTLKRWERVKAGEPLEAVLAEAPTPAAPAAPRRARVEALPAEASLEVLQLSTRVAKLLAAAGITSVGELLQRLSQGDEGLRAVQGLGPKSIEEIKEALRRSGHEVS